MQDLLDKIMELKKSLAAMKPKDDALVPALKLPSVKPLSVSSSGGAVKAKLPGVAPVSGKDPKKMAEQLKNPRPKKAKVEILKTDKNGQWSLVEKGWSDQEAHALYVKELADANKKVQHTSTGQRGVKAYTSANMGTAHEQAANTPHQGAASPVKHIPVAQHLSERGIKKFGEGNSV